MSNRIHNTFDGLYDKVRGDKDDFLSEDEFQCKVDELVSIEFVQESLLDDFTLYSARPGLKWSDFVHIDDSIKKEILLLLVANPTTFFILVNTQKGKSRISALEIKKWSEDVNKKVVGFVVVDNDKTLADQSADSFIKTIGLENVDLITLSSNSKTTYDNIKTKIDAYEFNNDYKMPLIVLLANAKQIEKMLRLIQYIENKANIKGSRLRHGDIWDEADKTYPQFRDKIFAISGESVIYSKFILQQNNSLYRLGFVTATDGELLETDEFPECANAHLYPVEISPEDQVHYRALHHPESITRKVPFTTRHTHNSYAMQIIEQNWSHFMTPFMLPSGETYYHKIIVNSNAKTEDMKIFAKWGNSKNIYGLVFNGYGGSSVKVYRPDMPVLTYKTKGKRFGETLFYIYKKLILNDKPIMIIGRRKVDRGLGFHYSPRTNDEIKIDGSDGILITKNKDGLIWTDEILGRIDDKNIAAQKAGRLAGIIANSPQYPGVTYYWTDEHTEMLIRRHNTIVDVANTYSGCSALQAVKHAEDNTPVVKVNHRVDTFSFLVYNNIEIVKDACELLFGARSFQIPNKINGFYETSLNTLSSKASLLEAIQHVPGAYGTQPKDKEGEDITKRKNKYIKIKSGEHNGKFGILLNKIFEGETIVKYNIRININLKDDVWKEFSFKREEFSLITYRTFYPCYKKIEDAATEHFVIIIRPGTDIAVLTDFKNNYPPIIIPQEGEF
jgi:hypothetical protein